MGALEPCGVSVKLAEVTVAASIVVEKPAVTAAASGTPMTPSAGAVDATVGPAGAAGAVAGAVVVKLQDAGAARAAPPLSWIVVSRVAVYDVPLASGALGVSVAV